MRKLAPLVATFLVCFTLLSLDQLQSTEARAVHHGRVKRVILSSQELQYLEGLYNNFLEVFNRDYQQTVRSNQFSVAAINRPDDLMPCPLVMNDDLGQISPERNNYLAYTPQPSLNPTRPNGQIHAETNILHHYDAITADVNVQSVHMVTHFSPCRFCTEKLRDLVTQHRETTFYIGYVEQYQNENILNYFIHEVGNEDNVRYGQISPSHSNCPPVHIELHHSNTCPVIQKCPSMASSGFPSTTMVYVYTGNPSSPSMKKMEDLLIGDEILTVNAQQQLLYNPVIAFLDQGHLSPSEFIEIETENNRNLQLTPSHLIFTSESSKPVYASNVTPGNYVFTLDLNDSVQPSKVTRVGTVTAVGKFAPLTAEGTILVDGILASCYANINAEQSDIHALFAPLRFLHQVVPQPSKGHQSQEGINWYARTLMHRMKHNNLPNTLLPSMVAG